MFLPKKSDIFDRLVKQSALVEETAGAFKEMTHRWNDRKNIASHLESLERNADEIVHAVTDAIEETFILPMDKEDIKELTESLDDVIDGIEQAANRIVTYEIPAESKELKDFSVLLLETAAYIHKGIILLQKHDYFSNEFAVCYKTLHEFENRGDVIHRKVVALLMKDRPEMMATDLLLAIKWKEIFQILEDTMDTCEDIAIIFERLRIKYQ